MGDSVHCIETVHRFLVPRHTANKDLRHCIQQHSMEYERERRLCKKAIQPPAEESSTNGPLNVRQAAGLVLWYKTGCFFVSAHNIDRCRGPPHLSIFKKLDKEAVIMWLKNSGKGESNVLQNQFTSYLTKAIYRGKSRYLQRQLRVKKREVSTEEDCLRPPDDVIHQILDIITLDQTLGEIRERDRYIFLERILKKRRFDDLAAELGLGYKGVAAVYYRVLQKLRDALRG